MEAYRRLAAVTDAGDVDDIRAEWEDRYGPPPATGGRAARRGAPPRRVAVRLGHRGRSRCSAASARIVGLSLRESQKVRLRRLAPKAVAKDEGEVVVPLGAPAAEVASALVELLDELVPAEPAEPADAAALASAAP